jgi:DNA-directed RNA polymerase specialized sigma24 family protein
MNEYDKLLAEFAKAAITGILAGKWGQMPQYKPEEAFAEFAFKIADEMMVAMIKRRRQQYEPIE